MMLLRLQTLCLSQTSCLPCPSLHHSHALLASHPPHPATHPFTLHCAFDSVIQSHQESTEFSSIDGQQTVPLEPIFLEGNSRHFDGDLYKKQHARRTKFKRLRPIDKERKYPSKPGKTQNVPPKAKWMIRQVRDSAVQDMLATVKKCAKVVRPDRADWLYLLKYLGGEQDKGPFFQIYEFVLLEESFNACAQDYTNLMLAYIEVKKYETAEQTMKIMEERDIYPDLIVYTVLITMYGKLGRADLVKEKFEELKIWGLEPDPIVYCAMIEAYCHSGQLKEAELCFKDMEAAGLPFKVQIFTSLIRGYGNLGQIMEAERTFRLLQLKCIYPDRRAYSALMDAYTKIDDLEQAMQVFENMLSVGMKPTDRSLARLVIACQNKNLLEQATNLLQKLESKCLKPGSETMVSFRAWLDKLGLAEEVDLLSGEIKKRRGLKSSCR